MKVNFIGQLYAESQVQDFLSLGWRLDNAADTLQKLIIKGLESNGVEVDIVSFPRVPTFPKIKHIYFKHSVFNRYNGSFTIPGFINIPVLKHLSKTIQTHKWLNSIYLKNDKAPIIIYSLHSPLLLPFIFTKNHGPIILIVPDLPAYMSSSKNLLYKIGKYVDNLIIKQCLKKADGFVLLSKFMNSEINKDNKPWILMEGICDDSNTIKELQKNIDIVDPYILYTGSLDRRYGIINLINAFIASKSGNTKLVICGKGDSESEINQIAQTKDCITFLGQIDRSDALALQRNALLLVNPRTSQGEFTKYSFPSKTMEYLASGTPTLMYRLPGIPEDYYNYFFSPENESIEALSLKITEVLNMPTSELKQFGTKAREFVINNKNQSIQTKKIINLIKNIMDC